MIENKRLTTIVIAVLLIACVALVIVINITKDTTYYIKQSAVEIDNSSDIVITQGIDGFTGRFPDVIQTDDGLLAAYYWNNIHAPYVIGDSLGVIKLQKGSKDGATWDSDAVDLIDSGFLIENGLGIWKGTDEKYYYTQEEAAEHNADLCVEARDPNFARMGNTLVMTFFTRLPWDSAFDGYTFLQYNENFDYTYGRTYIMTSDDNGGSWSKPTEVVCNYLDRGSAKRGNIAVIDDSTLLIPLYGYNSSLNTDFTTSNILAKYENGNWTFNEYSTHTSENVEALGAFELGVTEVSFAVVDQEIYAMLRYKGDILVSNDNGKDWSKIECSGRAEGFTLHQPSLQTIPQSKQIIASWAEPNDIGGRDIFLMLFKPSKDDVWRYSDKYRIYQNEEPGDMADPSSILLENNNVLTIYYDSQKEIVACTITNLVGIR